MMNTSLPYIDAVDEQHERCALELIQAEMVGRRPPAVPPLPPSAAEDNTTPHPKYSPPAPLQPPGDSSSLDDWKAAVQQARIAYEHERLQGLQLSVDTTTAPAVFRTLNATREDPRAAALTQTQQTQTSIVQHVNFERQRHQQDRVGPELSKLQTQCADLVEKQRQLRHAIQELEAKKNEV